MTDRELLELAAKAGGIRHTVEDDEYYKTHKIFGLWLVYDDESSEYVRRYWNPLLNDGDALHLAVELGMRVEIDIECEDVCAYIYAQDGKRVSACENFGVSKDRFAATRRAIVIAAAEIGKGML